MPGFGANEWLVDEMYEKYQQDPTSVDQVWWDFFGHDQRAAGSAHGSNGSAAPEAASSSTSHAVTESTGAPKSRPSGGTTPPRAESAARPQQEQKPAPAAQKAEKQKAEKMVEKTASTSRPTPKQAERPKEAEPADEPSYTVLRGAPARTVSNMDASLSVPTATSVRSVPVKLLWDNRIVINNHLARARGGKVSFTHLIGYALVKALTSMPDMNVGFDVVDGKPNLITPAHINLGLAIDLPKHDGTRQLLVPSIKGAESMDFAHFWTAYEDLVRKARDGKLTVDRLPGTTISLTNPGTHRHQPLRAAADEGPGRDHRRRLDGVPAGVPGRLARRRSPATPSARS